MQALYNALIGPFVEFGFMQRALAGSILLAISACPVGVFLMLRRMSLAGDAIAHSVLPGAAIGFLLFGLEILPMTIGGLIAGLVMALTAGAVSRATIQKEDASMAAFYLISLALGVLLVSMRGSSVDLMHVLFGTVLALDTAALWLIGSVTLITIASLTVVWRALVAECLDPLFLRSVSNAGPLVHVVFLILVVLNLVAGFQALGTLLAVGLMMLPALATRFWTNHVETMCLLAIVFGIVSSLAGLLVSYHFDLPSGPAIVLACGVLYAASILLGTRGIARSRAGHMRHRTA